MIVLDTDVVLELMRPSADPGVVKWLDAKPTGDIYVTAITAAELLSEATRLPSGNRKSGLADRIRRTLEEDFAGRVLAFDYAAAARYAGIVVGQEQAGSAISMADAQIAAICCQHGASLATRSTNDFARIGIDVIDPWGSAPSAKGGDIAGRRWGEGGTKAASRVAT